ncbi:MAG: hypothetical protein ACJASK_001531, partial [Ilumatobacter sp.]
SETNASDFHGAGELPMRGSTIDWRALIDRHDDDSGWLARVVGPPRLRRQEPAVGPVRPRDRFEFVRQNMAGAHDLVVLRFVLLDKLGRKQIGGPLAVHITGGSNTCPVGKCLVGRDVDAVGVFDAEHDVRGGREHVGDGRERTVEGTVEHAVIIAGSEPDA